MYGSGVTVCYYSREERRVLKLFGLVLFLASTVCFGGMSLIPIIRATLRTRLLGLKQ